MELLHIRCPGIEDGKFLLDHTGRGRDLSPELLLENLSPEAVTLAVTLEDLSHPIKGFTHWVIWNLPAADRIPGAIPAGRTVSGGGLRPPPLRRPQAAPAHAAHLPLHRLRPELRPGLEQQRPEKGVSSQSGGAHSPEGKHFRGI